MDNKPPDINTARLHSLLVDMIDIYSPSGKEEEIVSFLEDRCSSLPLVRQPVDEDRFNLVLIDENFQSQVVFVGHIDTVPAPDLENYESYRENDTIYGLGSADMKGGCAAMLEAFMCYAETCGTAFPAALALVVGEEESGDGIQTFLKNHHYPWAVVGEPTDLVPCLGHYGYIEMSLTTTGQRRHASVANMQKHAVREMLSLLMHLTTHFDTVRREIPYNIRDVFSSLAGFASPEWCEAQVDLHIPPQFPTGDLAAEIEELVSASLGEGERPGETLSFSTIHDGYLLPDRGFLPDTLRKVFNARGIPWKTGIFRSDSDASFLWQGGIKPVIMGPGLLEMAHSPEESISISQVNSAAGVYLDLLIEQRRVLNSGG